MKRCYTLLDKVHPPRMGHASRCALGYTFLALPICILILSACAAGKTDNGEIRNVEFTVVDREDVPQEFQAQIEKILKKKTYPYVVIKMEYTDKQIEFE